MQVMERGLNPRRRRCRRCRSGPRRSIAVRRDMTKRKRITEAVYRAMAERNRMSSEVRWLKHYSSEQSILVVGDGDFSFSLALATAFGFGDNIVATSLDSYEALIDKYSEAESNVMKLKILGAKVLHGVDAKTMKHHIDPDMIRLFDRIVFNFPHAGFNGGEKMVHMIMSHRELVKEFFVNAGYLLHPFGEIHVSHKTGYPYDQWDLEQLALETSLGMTEKVSFRKYDYPGYSPKRGDGARCNRSFPLGECCTFKFHHAILKILS